MRQPSAGRPSGGMMIAGLLIFILAVVTIVGALTAFQLPEAITEQGENTTVLYEVTLTVSFIIFFAVTSGIIYAIFRFKRVDNRVPPQIHGSPLVEYGGVFFAVIVLVALFIPALVLVLDLKSPPDDPDIRIAVVGHQWWWEFDYENGVKVQATPPNYDELVPPTLVVPAGKTIALTIRSTDVIHSFYAPNLLYKIQAIPGNVNQMHFKAKTDKIGTYTGQCYQFCGLRHADMRWNLQVMSQSDYDKWLSDQKNAAPAPRTQAQQDVKNDDLAASARNLFTTPIKGNE